MALRARWDPTQDGKSGQPAAVLVPFSVPLPSDLLPIQYNTVPCWTTLPLLRLGSLRYAKRPQPASWDADRRGLYRIGAITQKPADFVLQCPTDALFTMVRSTAVTVIT